MDVCHEGGGSRRILLLQLDIGGQQAWRIQDNIVDDSEGGHELGAGAGREDGDCWILDDDGKLRGRAPSLGQPSRMHG